EILEDPPPGYLFVCPLTDLQCGPSLFRWPDLAAYWSRDPFGAERLTSEAAGRLGFPEIKLTTRVCGASCDRRTYDGLRTFHRAKGFNPETQDVARYLGHPLLEYPG
ncbi:hypothetical protein B0H19DRAFT_906980, partial [Mycena capillaripes]